MTVISSLQLEFSDLGGNPYWMANGVTIRSAVTPRTLNGPDAVPADGTTLDTFVQTGLKGGDLYTVTTTLGTMTTADANPLYAGTQVAVDAGGKLSFQVLRPLAAGTATVTAQEVTGKGWGTATYTIPDVRRFDFNGSNNITASGFIGVRGKTTYSASLGYGWNVAAREFERTGPTALRRDGHYGVGSTGNRFTMQVDPAKQYMVRVYVGDASYLRDKIQVTVEGAASYTIAALAAGSFDARVTTAPLSASSDGRLTVTIRDLGGNSTWVVNGIDIWTPAAADPGAQQLRAETMALGANGSGSAPGVTLSSAALAPVVEQAIGIWAATGLSASQVALLRSTPVVVGELNAQGCLGITTPDRIVIDDDGAGRGWSYGGRKAKNSGSAVSSLANQPASFDLLTVVLHEMGHVLGHDHDRAADDLMAAVLQPGVLRLPMVDAVFVGW